MQGLSGHTGILGDLGQIETIPGGTHSGVVSLVYEHSNHLVVYGKCRHDDRRTPNASTETAQGVNRR